MGNIQLGRNSFEPAQDACTLNFGFSGLQSSLRSVLYYVDPEDMWIMDLVSHETAQSVGLAID